MLGQQLREERALPVEALAEGGQPRVAVGYAATAATTPRVDHESLRAIGTERSRSRVASSPHTTCAHLRPAVLNALEEATTATAWSAVPGSER